MTGNVFLYDKSIKESADPVEGGPWVRIGEVTVFFSASDPRPSIRKLRDCCSDLIAAIDEQETKTETHPT